MGVSKLTFQCGSRGCIKNENEGRRSRPMCLTDGAATIGSKPSDESATTSTGLVRGRIIHCCTTYSTSCEAVPVWMRHRPQVRLRLTQRLRTLDGSAALYLYFDAPSTIRLDKLLILNILCAITGIEARHAASLHLMKPHCGAPSMGMGEGRRIYLLFCVIRVGGDGQ